MSYKIPSLRPDRRWHALSVSVGRVAASCLGAGLFNLAWLAAFLVFAGKPPRGPVSWLLWCLAPPVTASGFCCGIIFFDRCVAKTRDSFLSVLPLPLVGCVIGAVVIIPIGQMFIGVAMFALGGLAVLLREVRLWRRNGGST